MNSIIALLVFCWFTPSFAMDTANLVDLPFEEIAERQSKREHLVSWLHSRHSPGHMSGEDDDVPAFLQFKPTRVELPYRYKLPEGVVVINDQLDLRSLTPQLLEELPKNDLKRLLQFLATIDVHIQYSNRDGKIISGKKHKVRRSSHWEKTNAAAAITLNLALHAQYDLFVDMMALVPQAVEPAIRGKMFGVMTPPLIAQVITAMLLQLDGDEVGVAHPMAKQIGTLIERGLMYWVGKDVRLFNDYLMTLLEVATPTIDRLGGVSLEQRHGILIGAVLAGIMIHVDGIKATDEKRIWVIGLIANLAWAATTFIGCAPLAAPVVAGLAGSISIGMVLSTAIMTALNFPRDYAPDVKEIEGRIEMGILEASRKKNVEEKVNLVLLLEWMQSSIHANGLNN